MGRLKWVSIVFACAAVSLAVGAGAFSSVSADRGAEVAVVPDDQALLGVETDESTGVVDGGSFSLLELTDRAGGSMNVESVAVSTDAIGDPPIEVASAEIDGSVNVRCIETSDETPVNLTITVAGDNVRITKHKDVTVTCNEPEPEPEFNGCGSVDTDATVAEKVYRNPGDGNGNGNAGKLVAVIIDGERYDNPNTCATTGG